LWHQLTGEFQLEVEGEKMEILRRLKMFGCQLN